MRKKKSERIIELYRRFESGKLVYKKEEAERYSVDQKTIGRDFNDIRGYYANNMLDGQKDKKIVYDTKRKGYYLQAEEGFLSESDVLLIAKVLLGSKGLIKDEMLPLIKRLFACCPDAEEQKAIKELTANEMLYYKGPVHGQELSEKINIISKAKRMQQRIEFDYKRLDDKVVHRVVEPVGLMFSEYYFYMDARVTWTHQGELLTDTLPYRIDRIQGAIKILDEHFYIAYSQKYEESYARESSPLMFRGKEKRLQFLCNRIALEAVLDRIPTAEIVREEDGKYLLSAKVCGDGAEMWLRGQGEYVELV